MGFVKNIQEIRDKARNMIENGPVTSTYALDRQQAIDILNEALATEIVCVLRYRFHYFMATGLHSPAVAEEFLEHSKEEQEHADSLAQRIKQLGGKPQMNPEIVSRTSHSQYIEGRSLTDMLKEDLIAERIAIDTYREIVRFFGDKDSTSRILMESILAKEEEHADELADLLFAVNPEGTDETRSLYFKDEVASTSNAGKQV
ncbi:MAG TPA: ferritin-like domain-containing protein [Acidobacteriota bacterium]|nr:ferritin-like domain-containing protein [Acidobacteriota bacterium]